jgi:hypothetical protein
MAVHVVRARDRDPLAEFLGWFSIGLGTAELTAPRAVARLVGADGDRTARLVTRAMGVRELVQGVGILTRPRPTAWVAMRVFGDMLDLSLLALTAVRHPDRRVRAAFGMANVVAVTVPDVLETKHLAEKRGEPRSATPIRKSVTIKKGRDKVEHAWLKEQELQQLVRDADGSVRFEDAPGGRGTEVIVEFTLDPPAGDLGLAALKLTGRDPATQLSDGLRRFKQKLEVGEVIRSDATPDGHELSNHLRQRAAQPLPEPIR